ncbi:MAG: hypothetical protein LBK67_04615, partial [Coriobacteriales bacterium]|nr:hypothetical protein [Coriobacteriales bacterium]
MITADPKTGLPVHQGIYITDDIARRIKDDMDNPPTFDFKRLFANERIYDSDISQTVIPLNRTQDVLLSVPNVPNDVPN